MPLPTTQTPGNDQGNVQGSWVLAQGQSPMCGQAFEQFQVLLPAAMSVEDSTEGFYTAWSPAPLQVEMHARQQDSFSNMVPAASNVVPWQGSLCTVGGQAEDISVPCCNTAQTTQNTWHMSEAPAAGFVERNGVFHNQAPEVGSTFPVALPSSPTTGYMLDGQPATFAGMQEPFHGQQCDPQQASDSCVRFPTALPSTGYILDGQGSPLAQTQQTFHSQVSNTVAFEMHGPFGGPFPVGGSARPACDAMPPPPCQPPVLGMRIRQSGLLPPLFEQNTARGSVARQRWPTPPPPPLAPVLRLSEALLPTERAPLSSIGSAMHDRGACRPCAFFHTRGCENAFACPFCHVCGIGEKKKRLKDKRVSRREAKYCTAEEG